MSQQAQRKNASPSIPAGAARKKRRPLADGPAVRRALELAVAEAEDSGGWKLLEAPVSSEKRSEHPVVDSTQPEPDWRVVAVADEADKSSLPVSGSLPSVADVQQRSEERGVPLALAPSASPFAAKESKVAGGKDPRAATGSQRGGARKATAGRRSRRPPAALNTQKRGRTLPTTKLSKGVERGETKRAPGVDAFDGVDAFTEAGKTRPVSLDEVMPNAASDRHKAATGRKLAPTGVPRPAANGDAARAVTIARGKTPFPSAPRVARSTDGKGAPRRFQTPVGRPANVVRAGPVPASAPGTALVSAMTRTHMGVAPPGSANALPKTFMGVAPPAGSLDLPRTHMGVAPPPPVTGGLNRLPPPPPPPASAKATHADTTVATADALESLGPQDLLEDEDEATVPQLDRPSNPDAAPLPPARASTPRTTGVATQGRQERAPVTQAWTLAETQLGARMPPAVLEACATLPGPAQTALGGPPQGPSALSQERQTGCLSRQINEVEDLTGSMRAGAVGNLFGAQGVVKKTRRARLLAGAAIGVLMACAPLAIFAVARLAPPSDSEALRAEVTPVAAKQAPVKTPTKPKDIDSALTASEAKAAAKSKPKAAHEKAVASRVATPEAGKAAAEPKVPSVSSEDIPWRDRPSVDAGNCESLAGERPPGPVGYLLNRASQDAHAELIRGNTKGAHLAFCQAIQLGEPSAKMLMGLARVLLMQSDLAEALTTVERVLEQKPESVQALELKGDILIRSGRVDEARQLWVKAAGGSRASALLVQNLLKANRKGASSAMKAGDLQRAERLLRRAIAFEVQDQETCLKLVSVLEKQGELSAAKRWTVYADSLAS